MSMVHWTSVEGSLAGGETVRVYAAVSDGRIFRTAMHADGHPCSEDDFLWRIGGAGYAQRWPSGTGSGLLDAAVAQIQDYFDGLQTEFDLPLEFEGTPFQVQVWKTLAKIPYGETCSYGDVAERMGKPGAMRAVGQANGRNNLPLLIPCHRVIAAGGKLGGFTGGVSLKKALLAHEAAIALRRNGRTQPAVAGTLAVHR